MRKIEVTFDPTEKQVRELEEWLITEFNKKGPVQFYHNWDSIYDSFKEEKMVILIRNGQVIGFMTWSGSGRVHRILYAEIKAGFRKKGYGRILTEALFTRLKEEGVSAIDLHCQPASSEIAWKKLGFKNYPAVDGFKALNLADGKYLYKPLVPYAKPTIEKDGTETIEIWAVDAYMASRHLPEWKWHLEFENGTRKLKEPIIFSAKCEWHIAWKINGKIVKEDPIKHFSNTEITFRGELMILEDLPYPKGYQS